jgi:TolB protein
MSAKLGSRLVAARAPHYAYWSPDGSYLAFIGNTAQGLTLYLDDLRDVDGAQPILDRGPLWMDWSPQSAYLFVHRGRDHLMVDTEEGFKETLNIASDGLGYSVPAWKPPGDEITFVAGDISRGYGLYTAGPDGRDVVLVDQVPPNTAFLWSPDGEVLAMTRTPPEIVPYGARSLRGYGQVSLYSADGVRLPVEIEDNVIAFFWSPDGGKLAYVTMPGTQDLMRLMVLEVGSGDRWPLIDFFPSDDQVTMFQFFDQYAHSHSLWSPDGKSLVLAGRIAGQAVSASMGRQPVNKIIVLGTHKATFHEAIAEGELAIWSPR